VRLLTWLFGKKEQVNQPVEAAHPAPTTSDRPGPPPNGHRPAPPTTIPEDGRTAPSSPPDRAAESGQPTSGRSVPASSEADNLSRWRASGQARAWVEAHNYQWNHADWLALLAQLERSPYWPMRPEQVGLTLEEIRCECRQRT
jgi:hypothetical protein